MDRRLAAMIEPDNRPWWRDERGWEMRRAIEAPGGRAVQYKSAIGSSVMGPIYSTRQGDPVSIPSTSVEDNPRLGPCPWIIIRVI